MIQTTKNEKIIISALLLICVCGTFFLFFKVSMANRLNDKAIKSIKSVAEFTDKTPLVKGIYYDKEENIDKLNLNKTDLRSIKDIPGMTARLAKAIYKYIQNKDNQQLKSLNELLNIKGFSKKKLAQFEPYITVEGGHAGYKAWGNKLNVNFARECDLSSLPGISDKIAKDIVEYRNNHGNITYLEELLEIKSLKKTTFNRIKNLITVQ